MTAGIKVYLLPAYMKPWVKITTRLIPMCLAVRGQEIGEYILDFSIAPTAIKNETLAWDNGLFMVLDQVTLDLGAGRMTTASRFKVWPSGNQVRVSVSAILDYTEPVQTLQSTIQYEIRENTKLLKYVAQSVMPEHPVIAKPQGWLVLDEKENVLTRLVWVEKATIKEIKLLARNLVLIAEGVSVYTCGKISPMVIRKATNIYMQLSTNWDSLMMSQSYSLGYGEEMVGVYTPEESISSAKTPAATGAEVGGAEGRSEESGDGGDAIGVVE